MLSTLSSNFGGQTSNFKLGLRNFGKIETDKKSKLMSRLNTTGVTLDASNRVTL